MRNLDKLKAAVEERSLAGDLTAATLIFDCREYFEAQILALIVYGEVMAKRYEKEF